MKLRWTMKRLCDEPRMDYCALFADNDFIGHVVGPTKYFLGKPPWDQPASCHGLNWPAWVAQPNGLSSDEDRCRAFRRRCQAKRWLETLARREN